MACKTGQITGGLLEVPKKANLKLAGLSHGPCGRQAYAKYSGCWRTTRGASSSIMCRCSDVMKRVSVVS